MRRNGTQLDRTWLNDKFKEGYGEYFINNEYRVLYWFEIGTFSFKDRFKILTPSENFVHQGRSGSRSWNDDLEFIGSLADIRKIKNF